jgi:hypothetical protein
MTFNLLKSSGFKLCILPIECICVFCMILTINSNCFPKQHQPDDLCSGDATFPVRYKLNFFILLRKNSVFQGLDYHVIANALK